MKYRKFLSLLLSVVLFLSCGLYTLAEEYSPDTNSYTAANGYSYNYMVPKLDKSVLKFDDVYDFADLLTDEEESYLSKIALEQGKNYGLQIVFLTYEDSFGRDTQTFTDDFLDYFYGIDIDAVLLAVDMDNREVYINTVGSAIANISDDEWSEVLDDTYTYASDEDYYGFFVNTLDQVLYAYDDDGDVYSPYDYGGDYGVIDSAPNPFVPSIVSLIVTVVVTAAVLAAAFASHNKANKAPSANNYLKSFEVLDRQEHFMGVRHEVMLGYYADTGSGGGGSSHSSGGGGSHGGGGHGF